jgi:hypothetical protein
MTETALDEHKSAMHSSTIEREPQGRKVLVLYLESLCVDVVP